MTLRIARTLARVLDDHLARAYPREGCGVLLGIERGGLRIVTRVIPVDNAAARATEFVIPPGRLREIDAAGRAEGLEILGFFHSHPDHDARPSPLDLERAWPYYTFVIAEVGPDGVKVRTAWRLLEGASAWDPEPIEIEDDEGGAPGNSRDS